MNSQSAKNFFKNVFLYNESKQYDFSLPETSNAPSEDIENNLEKVSANIDENLNSIKIAYNSLINSDIIIRDFTLIAR